MAECPVIKSIVINQNTGIINATSISKLSTGDLRIIFNVNDFESPGIYTVIFRAYTSSNRKDLYGFIFGLNSSGNIYIPWSWGVYSGTSVLQIFNGINYSNTQATWITGTKTSSSIVFNISDLASDTGSWRSSSSNYAYAVNCSLSLYNS